MATHKEHSSKYRLAHQEECRARVRAWNKSPNGTRIRGAWERSREKEWRKAYYRKKRLEIVTLLGNQCRCCGESTFEFLAIDHVYGGGRQARINGNTALSFFATVRKSPHCYRLLCHNCNMAYGRYGFCPHVNSRVLSA